MGQICRQSFLLDFGTIRITLNHVACLFDFNLENRNNMAVPVLVCEALHSDSKKTLLVHTPSSSEGGSAFPTSSLTVDVM